MGVRVRHKVLGKRGTLVQVAGNHATVRWDNKPDKDVLQLVTALEETEK